MGEYFVFKLLEKHAGPAFGFENWTSELRHKVVEQFSEWRREDPGKEYADFTFTDTSHDLTRWLVEQDVPSAAAWLPEHTTYHVEVKSTRGSCDEAFHMSGLQMAEARRMSIAAAKGYDKHNAIDVYLLFRVYNLANTLDAKLEVRADPWKMINEGDVDVRGWLLSLR